MNSKFIDQHKAPATMSTQHPDNAAIPEWSTEEVINGTAEVYEAFYSYSTLGCQEVMWDSEGKDTDTRVVRKLLQKHWDYFSAHTIGEDVYLTYRIPNPKIEGAERKFFMETLQNIPVAYDVASLMYKRPVTPIFEVILPFTTDAQELIMLLNYYKKAIIADEELTLYESTKTKDWLGSFHPKTIKVIPLVEDFDSILHVDNVILPYLNSVKPARQRVFLARSDPALNYGLLCAVLLTKIALSKLKQVEKQQNTPIEPIMGVGSKPFRGHLSPENIDNFLGRIQRRIDCNCAISIQVRLPPCTGKGRHRLPKSAASKRRTRSRHRRRGTEPSGSSFQMQARVREPNRVNGSVHKHGFSLCSCREEQENSTSGSSATAEALRE